MIYFSLPNHLENFHLNTFIYGLSRSHPNYFKDKISFYNYAISFPYLSWNGGSNNNAGPGVYYNTMLEFGQNLVLPGVINCANVLLEDYDFYDCQGQTILEIFNNGSNIIEISSIPFKEQIENKYPNYRYKFSKQADLITEFTPEILEAIHNQPEFLYIGIPDKYSRNLGWLKNLGSKRKLEITVNPICDFNCQQRDVCLLKEHQNQLDYSGEFHCENCKKHIDNFNLSNMLTIEEIKKSYLPIGINHFTFAPSVSRKSDDWSSLYINYFIKPEYQVTVLQMLGSSFRKGFQI